MSPAERIAGRRRQETGQAGRTCGRVSGALLSSCIGAAPDVCEEIPRLLAINLTISEPARGDRSRTGLTEAGFHDGAFDGASDGATGVRRRCVLANEVPVAHASRGRVTVIGSGTVSSPRATSCAWMALGETGSLIERFCVDASTRAAIDCAWPAHRAISPGLDREASAR